MNDHETKHLIKSNSQNLRKLKDRNKAFLLIEATMILGILLLISTCFMIGWGGLLVMHHKGIAIIHNANTLLKAIECRQTGEGCIKEPITTSLDISDLNGKRVVLDGIGTAYTYSSLAFITDDQP